MTRHHGRTAVVTGAGSGIGRATARRLAADGASIGVLDRDADGARATVEAVEADGGTAAAVVADVRDRSQVRAARDAIVDRFGGIDLLVNNAGLVTMDSFAELTEEAWDLVLDVNLKGMWIVSQEIAPSIADRGGGAIVCLSTVESEVIVSADGRTQPHYNASKGGVRMLMKAMAVELADQGIRVNAVAPGPVDTDFIPGGGLHSEQARTFMNQRLLIRRPGRPDEIAAAISFLLSDDASYITGAQLPVDGGWTVR